MDLEKVGKDCEFIQTLLREAFPNFLIQINVQRILGWTVRVMFANVPGKKAAPYGILENASFVGVALIQENRDGTCYMDCPAHMTRNIKFRKISGKDHSTVLAKFHDWMIRNREAILAITPRYNTVG